MDGQMSLFDFIDKKPVQRKPAKEIKEPSTDDEVYLGLIAPEYAEKIKGEKIAFRKLKDMIGERVLLVEKVAGTIRDLTICRIVKVDEFIEDTNEDVYDEQKDDVKTVTCDMCYVRHYFKKKVPRVMLFEINFVGGRGFASKRCRKWLYTIKEDTDISIHPPHAGRDV